MKKIAVLALLALTLLVGIAIGWMASGSLPDWYQGIGPSAVTGTEPARAPRPPSQTANGSADPDVLLRRLRADGRVSVDETALAQLATAALSGSQDGREFLRVSDGLEARIDGEEVEIGGVFDLGELDESALSADAREGLGQLRRMAPFLLTGERYLGIRGTPEARAGSIAFAPGATLRIGAIGFPIDALVLLGADELGEAELRLPDLHVTRVVNAPRLLTIEARPS